VYVYDDPCSIPQQVSSFGFEAPDEDMAEVLSNKRSRENSVGSSRASSPVLGKTVAENTGYFDRKTKFLTTSRTIRLFGAGVKVPYIALLYALVI
jgi:hypothetical protein